VRIWRPKVLDNLDDAVDDADSIPDDEEMHRRREEGCRREEAIRSLLKRHGDKRLTSSDVEAVAWELGVSRATMYRLVSAYRAKGTVSSVEPQTRGRRKDSFVLDRNREKLIAANQRDLSEARTPNHDLPYRAGAGAVCARWTAAT
jgi:putative transposase